MTISSSVSSVDPKDQLFPVLRQFNSVRDASSEKVFGPLVVLFLSPKEGVALAGVCPERLGKREHWAEVTDTRWVPTSITLKSED